jgi:fructose 1,6-bisphosphate aldolase/phosphatase
VRSKTAAKSEELRRQGFFGPAMLPYSELEYGGIVDRLKEMEGRFRVVTGKEAVEA